MWIRSQNKKILSKVNEVLICTMDDNKYFIEGFWNRGSDTLGIYSSEEKALKLLDEIQKQIEYPYNEIFQMPQDWEVEIWFQKR